jgi:outer membrane protein assembly factor BamB
MLRPTLALGAALWLATTLVGFAASEWPQFRGRTSGVAEDNPALPDRWSTTENVRWSVEIPGIGWSSPIVWDDLIFLTSVVKPGKVESPERGFYGGVGTGEPVDQTVHRWMVYAVDFNTGKIRWEREVRQGVPLSVKHGKNTYASETPVTDGERVYVYFADLGLFAFDMAGKPVWNKPMDPMKMRAWGSGASPTAHGGRVYVVNDNDDRSWMAAYDGKTGNQIWRVLRDETSNWSTPFVWQHEKGTEIITTGSKAVRSYDLDGKVKWQLTGLTSLHVPTPVARRDLLFISSGFLGDSVRPVFAVRPGASGDISLKPGEPSNAFIVWSNPRLGTYDTSPIVYGDYYYTLMDRGFLLCHDARTGAEAYSRQRITGEASGFTASPWAYNGRIFALSEDGDTFVMQAGKEFKVLGKNSLGEMAMATPAIAGDSLIVRTATRLYRISNK